MSWPTSTLDELKAPGPRSITDGPFGSNLARRHYTDFGPRVVRLQNIGDGVFVDEKAHISEEHFTKLRAHEVLPGDLLVASLGEVLPRACIAPGSLGPAVVKADCIRVRLRDDVDARWVLYALQRPSVRRWADEHRHGVGRPRLGLKTIRRIPIPLPPLATQRRVVAILEDHLSRLDAADAGLSTIRARLVAFDRANLEKHFGNRGPTVALGELVTDISAGRSFGGVTAPAREDEWGIIKVSAMTWGEFRPDENKAVAAERVDERYEIREGDLLVSRANTTDYVGASVLVGPVRPKLLLSDKSLRLTPRDGIDSRWLWRAMQAPSSRRQISALATGTKDSMRNISQSALREVALPRPDLNTQFVAVESYESVADSMAAARSAVAVQMQRSRGLRRALLAAAFAGRLTGSSKDWSEVEGMISA